MCTTGAHSHSLPACAWGHRLIEASSGHRSPHRAETDLFCTCTLGAQDVNDDAHFFPDAMAEQRLVACRQASAAKPLGAPLEWSQQHGGPVVLESLNAPGRVLAPRPGVRPLPCPRACLPCWQPVHNLLFRHCLKSLRCPCIERLAG